MSIMHTAIAKQSGTMTVALVTCTLGAVQTLLLDNKYERLKISQKI